MILASESDKLLNAAFSSLNDSDKYETVLSGLCAKVIDGGEDTASEGLVDPFRLMEEMNSSRIVAGPRGVIGLVDVSLSTSSLLCSSVQRFAIPSGRTDCFHSLLLTIYHITFTNILFRLQL